MEREQNPPRPLTVAAAVAVLLAGLDPAALAELRDTPEDAVIDHHFGLGRVIRNGLGLHHDNPALLADCRTLDPDDASLVILRALWRQLQLQ